MDIVRFKGGLGNQMFQYAFAEALRSQGRKVSCNLGFYRLHPELRQFVLDQVFSNVQLNEIEDDVFNEIDKRWKTVKQNDEKLHKFKENSKERFFWVEEKDCVYEEEVFQTSNCAFVGYWQTPKYFEKIRDKILYSFKFDVREKKLELLGETLKANYFGVHIRRGDFQKCDLHNICTESYYHKAIEYVNKTYQDAKFIFFSDDVSWVKDKFGDENGIVCEQSMFDDYQDWYDMYLMTQCRGNIISNSSFSWWGAWLNSNEIVIAPSIWLRGMETPDIWCDGWIKICVE